MSDDRQSPPDPATASLQFRLGAELPGMIGTSAPARALFAAIPRVAARSSALLIRGEPGTGKERVARLVHSLSERADRPLVSIDCAAAPKDQVRASLSDGFGSAQGGSVLLKNVGCLSVSLQALLLRALRGRETGVPAAAVGRPDIRIISTTDTDLAVAVETGRFREALHDRLNALSVEAPPLRERGNDVQLLADFFLERFTTPGSRRRVVGFTSEARLAMQKWSWPGNVRELEDRIKRAIVLCEKGPLFSSDLGLDHAAQGGPAIMHDDARAAGDLDRP